MAENWRAIHGFEGCYEVSDMGRVRSLDRHVADRWGSRVKMGKMLNPTMNCGYRKVTLRNGGQMRVACVHILVLETFVGPRPGHSRRWHGCHGDGNVENNALDNLRWDTVVGNGADARKHGTSIKGEGSPSARLTEMDVVEIKRLLGTSMARNQIARRFGISAKSVRNIADEKTWYWVKSPLAHQTQPR